MIHAKNQNGSDHIPFIYLDCTRTSAKLWIIWDKVTVASWRCFCFLTRFYKHPSSVLL